MKRLFNRVLNVFFKAEKRAKCGTHRSVRQTADWAVSVEV